ncbi:hypothetical protein [Burkholderia cenocepacia]|uniref:hypothetical protein n=1 Tax=Burkholderia cenocepacia TaxID=95486 RepID=UPI001ABB438D|nr:hypothetical protein [Burkholderia cenocepacia]
MTISKYAIVESGVVANIVLWDGTSEWDPPTGAQVVPVPAGTLVCLGYTYDGAKFSPGAAPAA